jgi:plasmid stabilization system protein ParE
MIFYFSIEEGIEIFRVVHGHRDIEAVFEDMMPPEETN